MKAIITVLGKDQVGIIAGVSSLLAKWNVNVLDISQTIMREYFTMVMLVDAGACDIPFAELAALLEEAAARKGRHAAIRLNRPQAVLEVHFQEAPPAEACTAQEANEGEEEG